MAAPKPAQNQTNSEHHKMRLATGFAPGDVLVRQRLSEDGLVVAGSDQFTIGEIIGEGTEGYICEIKDDDTFIVKIYKKTIFDNQSRSEIHAKIEAIVKNRVQFLKSLPFAITPGPLVYHASVSMKWTGFTGYIMPRVTGHDKIANFLNADYRLSDAENYRIAAVCFSALAAMHRKNVLFCDISYNNILIQPKAKSDGRPSVAFIDTDSYQYLIEGVLLPSKVATAGPAHPDIHEVIASIEAKGKTLPMPERKAEHDVFAMAYLIFQLLFGADDPFSGETKHCLGEEFEDYPLINKQNKIFCYDHEPEPKFLNKDIKRLYMETAARYPKLGDLFYYTFSQDPFLKQSTPPTAEQWAQVLGGISHRLSPKWGVAVRFDSFEDLFLGTLEQLAKRDYQNRQIAARNKSFLGLGQFISDDGWIILHKIGQHTRTLIGVGIIAQDAAKDILERPAVKEPLDKVTGQLKTWVETARDPVFQKKVADSVAKQSTLLVNKSTVLANKTVDIYRSAAPRVQTVVLTNVKNIRSRTPIWLEQTYSRFNYWLTRPLSQKIIRFGSFLFNIPIIILLALVPFYLSLFGDVPKQKQSSFKAHSQSEVAANGELSAKLELGFLSDIPLLYLAMGFCVCIFLITLLPRRSNHG